MKLPTTAERYPDVLHRIACRGIANDLLQQLPNGITSVLVLG